MRSLFPPFLISALLAFGVSAYAAPVPLFTQAPYDLTTFNPQDGVVDGCCDPLVQTFTGVPPGSILEQIVVWGKRFDLDSYVGVLPVPDNFEITLGDNTLLLGVVGVIAEAAGAYTKYTIDVDDTHLTSSFFSLRNNGDTSSGTAFNWYWANSESQGYISDEQYHAAYELQGSLAATVPEPGTLVLLGLAGAGAAFASRRRHTAG